MNLISVIMPVYNGSNYLKESIESVLCQSHKNFELIIIDDGSTDSTIEIINKFNDRRIKFFRNIKNKGIVYSLNFAISKSKGTFIARMDSDDISFPNRLETQLEYLVKNNLDLIGSSVIPFKNEVIFKSINYPKQKYIHRFIKFGNPFAHPTVFGKSKVFKDNKYLYSKNSEDLLFWSILVFKGYKLDNINVPLVKYRIHDSNASNFNNENYAHLIYYMNYNNVFPKYLTFIKNGIDEKFYHFFMQNEPLSYWDKIWLENYRMIVKRNFNRHIDIDSKPNSFTKAKVLIFYTKNLIDCRDFYSFILIIPNLLNNLSNIFIFYLVKKRNFRLLNLLKL